MAAPTKTPAVLLTHQAVTHPATIKGGAVNVSTFFACDIAMYHAMVEAISNANPAEWLIQYSLETSGDDTWFTRATFTVNTGTPATELLSGTEAIGQTVLEVASTTGFVQGAQVYVQDASVPGDGQWGLLDSVVTNTSLTLIDGLKVAKDSSDIVWDNANILNFHDDILSVMRLRILFRTQGAAAVNSHVMALLVTADTIA